MKRARRRFVGLVVGCLSVAFGAGVAFWHTWGSDGAGWPGRSASWERGPAGGLSLSLELDKTRFRLGERVHYRVELRNLSTEELTLLRPLSIGALSMHLIDGRGRSYGSRISVGMAPVIPYRKSFVTLYPEDCLTSCSWLSFEHYGLLPPVGPDGSIPEGWQHTAPLPGRYTLQATYQGAQMLTGRPLVCTLPDGGYADLEKTEKLRPWTGGGREI